MSVPAKSATAMAAVAQTVPVSAAGTNGPTPVLTHEFGEKTRAAQTARPTSTTTKDVDIDSEGTALEALANVARGSFSAAVRGVSGSQFPAETGDVNESTDPPMGEAPDSSQMTAESASAITGPVLSERARRLLGYGLCITVAIILLAVIGAWAFG